MKLKKGKKERKKKKHSPHTPYYRKIREGNKAKKIKKYTPCETQKMKFFGLKPVLKTSLIRIRLSLIRTRLSLIRSAYKPYRKPTPKSSLKRGKDLGEGRSKVNSLRVTGN